MLKNPKASFKIHTDEKENLHPVVSEDKPTVLKEIQNGPPREHFRVLNSNTNQGQFSAKDNKMVAADSTGSAVDIKDEVYVDLTSMSISDISSMSVDYDTDSSLTSDEFFELDSTPPVNDDQSIFEVVIYQIDILKRCKNSEIKYLPKANYMVQQEDITHQMRSIVVDWLIDVAQEFQMDTETLYLTIAYMDRYLSSMAILRPKLQLVAVAALHIACKYEEVYPPPVSALLTSTDNSYTKQELLQMEEAILKILSFEMCIPTPYVFINAFSVICDHCGSLKYLSLFICELSLVEGEIYLKHLPSHISAASMALARLILGMDIWTAKLANITTYTLDDLKGLILQLCKTHKASKDLKNYSALRNKYNGQDYQKVASIDGIDLTINQLEKLSLAVLDESF